jgi:hypothetical protein
VIPVKIYRHRPSLPVVVALNDVLTTVRVRDLQPRRSRGQKKMLVAGVRGASYCPRMDRRQMLVVVSGAQLLAGLAGQVLAVRRRLAFDIALISWRGRKDRVAHDTWLLGTGLSAPVTMLAVQAGATVRVALHPDPLAERVLGVLGSTMVGGYLIEREFRAAMTPSGWDPTVTPVAVAGAGLAAVMAGMALLRPRSNHIEGGNTVLAGLWQ